MRMDTGREGRVQSKAIECSRAQSRKNEARAMKKMVVWFAAAGLVLGMAVTAGAGPRRVLADGRWTAQDIGPAPLVPPVWEHAGRILDDSGNPLTGAQTLEVRLYGAADGGDALWGRQAPVMLDENGAFSVRLTDALTVLDGTPEASLADVLAAGPVWIECTLSGHGGAMAPRAAVAANPYALYADEATAARGDFDVAGSLKVAGATQAQNLDARGATSSGAVGVANQLSAAGNVSLAGGLKAKELSGIGAVPVGTIILWYGDTSSIPAGWALCDGSADGLPDMRGRFPVGAGDQYQPGDTGGEESVTLSSGHIPSHTHNYTVHNASNTHYMGGIDTDNDVWDGDSSGTTGSVGGDSGGNTQPHENRPPFKAIHFIMRVS